MRRQHLSGQADSFNGFLISMLAAHLVQQSRLVSTTQSPQPAETRDSLRKCTILLCLLSPVVEWLKGLSLKMDWFPMCSCQL